MGIEATGAGGNTRPTPGRRRRRPQDRMQNQERQSVCLGGREACWLARLAIHETFISISVHGDGIASLPQLSSRSSSTVGPSHDGEPNAPSYPMGSGHTSTHDIPVHSYDASPYRTWPHHSGGQDRLEAQSNSWRILSLPRANGVCYPEL